MRYGEMTSSDLGEAVAKRIVVIPLGSMEQHGRHLPLLTDTFLVTGVAQFAETRLSDRVLLTPTLWVGASDHHLDFPGTISLPNSLYSETVKAMVRTVVGAGAERVCLLNGHGGNIVPVDQAMTELSNEGDVFDRTWIVSATYWQLAAAAMAGEKHGMATPELSHACEYETSMMLHLHNDLVHLDRAIEGDPPLASQYWGEGSRHRVSAFKRFARQSAAGSMGRPSAATAEKGKSLIDAIGRELIAFLDEFATWPTLEKLTP